MSHIVTLDDVEVHIEGDGAETILMVHGWPDTYRLWDAQVQAFKSNYRCIRFTLPGFDATKPRKAHSLDDLMGFMKKLIEQLCADQKVILMLHDWGCAFGYQFYLRNPQMVSKIVGVDIGDSASLAKSMTPREGLMALTYQVWLAIAWKIGGNVGDRMTRYMARQTRCPSDPSQIHSCMSYPYYIFWFGGRQSYRHHMKRFMPTCPMLFIYGSKKPISFHAKSWTDDLQTRKGNQVLEFKTGH